MNLAILSVEGPDSALTELRKALALECDVEWRRGEQGRDGRARTSSGFSATIADTDSSGEFVDIIRAFLTQCYINNIDFRKLSLSAELRIGFTVGDSEQYVGSIALSPSELLQCAECGIAIKITAYPTSDEANIESN